MGRRHRGPVEARVERVVGLDAGRADGRAGRARRDHADAGRRQVGLVVVGPGRPVGHRKGAALAGHAARREVRQRRAVDGAGGDREDPWGLGVRVVRVRGRALVAGGEEHGDAVSVEVVRRLHDGVRRVEGARRAPRVGHDADAVRRLVRERVVEPAEAVEDEERGAGAVADEVGARRDALLAPPAGGARAADDAGHMRAVPRVRVGRGDALDVGDRQDAHEGVEVGRPQHVLDKVLAVRQVAVEAVDAAVVDHDADAPAGDREPAVGPLEVPVHARRVDARQGALVGVEIGEPGVRPDRDHVAPPGQRGDLRPRGDDARDGQRAEREAPCDAERAERGDLGARRRALAPEGDDDGRGLERRERVERALEAGAEDGLGERGRRGEADQEQQGYAPEGGRAGGGVNEHEGREEKGSPRTALRPSHPRGHTPTSPSDDPPSALSGLVLRPAGGARGRRAALSRRCAREQEAPPDGEPPSPDGEGPSPDGEDPSRCGERPSRAGESPSLAGEGPSLAGEGPSLAGEGPPRGREGPPRRRQRRAPRREGPPPRRQSRAQEPEKRPPERRGPLPGPRRPRRQVKATRPRRS